jgi:cytochrome c oxidase cbb3-type subunit I
MDSGPELYRENFYNDKVVRQFAVMTVVWGIVGMAVGVLIAAQLYWPSLNFDLPWLSYGRLRPLHTNAVIFALAARRCSRRATTSCSAPATCGCSPIGSRPSRSGAGRR